MCPELFRLCPILKNIVEEYKCHKERIDYFLLGNRTVQLQHHKQKIVEEYLQWHSLKISFHTVSKISQMDSPMNLKHAQHVRKKVFKSILFYFVKI